VFEGFDGSRSAYTPCNLGLKMEFPATMGSTPTPSLHTTPVCELAAPRQCPARARPFLGKVLADKQTPVLDIRRGPGSHEPRRR
jgi:hypothetical protein